MWLSEITLEQIESLETTFAELKEGIGWVIPCWLVEMRRRATERNVERSIWVGEMKRLAVEGNVERSIRFSGEKQ